MSEREYRLDELVDRVVDLLPIEAEDLRVTDVDPAREGPLTANLRLLAAIGSLGPGEFGPAEGSPSLHWGPLHILEPLRPEDDELYLAVDEDRQRRHWLRLLPPARQDPLRGRRDLEQEAQRLSAVTHPDLAPVRGAGSHQGRTGIWVDALEGRRLDECLEPPLAWPDACDLVLRMADVLGTLHAHGLIHRRLGPDRIVLTAQGPVLVDLGADEPGAGPDAAPEVARGAAPTVRSDIHALGRLLCACTGSDAHTHAEGRLAPLLHPEPDHRCADMTAAVAFVRSLRSQPPPAATANIVSRALRRLRAGRRP